MVSVWHQSLSAAQEQDGGRVTAGGLAEIKWITALWSEGLPEQSINTEQIQCHMVNNITSTVFSSASSWLCCLLCVCACMWLHLMFAQTYRCLHVIGICPKESDVSSMYSTLDRSSMHVHHGSQWLVELILPPSCFSLSLSLVERLEAERAGPLKPTRGWVLSPGITGLKLSQTALQRTAWDAVSLLGRAWATLTSGCGRCSWRPAEREGRPCSYLCFHVKMNLFPCECKQDTVLTQEIIIEVLTCRCVCVPYALVKTCYSLCSELVKGNGKQHLWLHCMLFK